MRSQSQEKYPQVPFEMSFLTCLRYYVITLLRPGFKDSFNESYYLHWEQLELLSKPAEVAAMRAKDAAILRNLTVGKSRVRMTRDFEKVVKGDEGTYLGTNGGF